MDAETFLLLRKLRQFSIGPDFGKICQSLLALLLRQNGFDHVVNRLVEGMDIDAAGVAGRFAIEVKTTEGNEILIGDKDVKGWTERKRDRYVPVLAALRISFLSEWTLCEADDLPKGSHRIQRLRLHEIHSLTTSAIAGFEVVISKHVPALLNLTRQSPLEYLKGLLKSAGVEAQD